MQEAYVFDMGGVIKESFDLEKFYSRIDSKKDFNSLSIAITIPIFISFYLLPRSFHLAQNLQ